MSETDPANAGQIPSLKKKAIRPSNRAQISLPRLKKVKRDLLTELPLESQECQQEILSVLKKSFHSQTSIRTHEFKRVQAVNNPELTSKYLEKRREWKSFGYSDSLLADTYAFLAVENQAQVEKLCRNGVSCGNQAFSGLGVSHMAVHLSKHADILVPSKQTPGDKICVLVKLLKGKVKTVVCKNVGVQLEPTPNYDCHIAKPNVEQPASLPFHLLFYSLQLYVYEYGDLGVEDYPKQILPFAVIHYTVKELPVPLPKQISNVPRGAVFKPDQLMVHAPRSEHPVVMGPKNEIWRGKLHLSLVDGGNLNIEVSLFSKFVPLTVNLLSPLKIYKLYPESNAQFTYFAGLTDIADKPEVPWREHYFRSFVMRPRRTNEDHFRALVKHISDRREMPCIGLPNDVFLFLMTNCLLASQLGLVQRDDNSPVLHCVLMSKFSTIKAEKKKMKQRMGNGYLRRYGKATSWSELFDDSDNDEEEKDTATNPSVKVLKSQQLDSLFQQQRLIQNKLAALSIADMAANVAPCDCVLLGDSAKYQKERRNSDIVHMVGGIEASIQHRLMKSKEPPVVAHFPPGSRTKPKHHTSVSHRSRGMSSFSPHGSSDSDSSDYETGENGKRSRCKKHYSVLMNSHKTVEEELSEEELTAEQMDDIIFMRKPSTVAQAKSTLLSRSESKQTSSHKSEKLSLLSKPKIIPVEPMEEPASEIASPPRDSNSVPPQPTVTKIIPTVPVNDSPLSHQSLPTTVPTTTSCPSSLNTSSSSSSSQSQVQKPDLPKPKSILKKKSVPTAVVSILKKAETLQSSVPSSSSMTTPSVTDSNSIIYRNPELTMKILTTKATKSNSTFPSMTTSKSTTEIKISTTRESSLNMHTTAMKTPVVETTASTHYSSQNYPKDRLPNQQQLGGKLSNIPLPPPPLPPMPMVGDMGDIDMRIAPAPHPRFQNTTPSFVPPNPHFSSNSSSSSSHLNPQTTHRQHRPLSPSLTFGSWLGPQDLLKHSTSTFHNSPSSSHSISLSQSQSHSSKSFTTTLSSSSSSSPFKPSAPVEDQFDIDTSITSPPSMSPPSPSPLDSPMSPPKFPQMMDIESPASPPMSNELRSSPIAIPTVRVQSQRSISSSIPSPSSPISPTMACSPLPCDTHTSPSPMKHMENADDMKDFLNSATGFDSELDSPNEDDSFKNDGCVQTEAENADDMKYFLNSGIGGFGSESPFNDDSSPVYRLCSIGT